jgi:aspartyl-tRNA(Asn)/glutamyl-tRNA(Gln) amidotransferase subunit A
MDRPALASLRHVTDEVRLARDSARARCERAIENAEGHMAGGDSGLGVFLHLCRNRARAEADAVDAAVAVGRDPGALSGAVVGLKDIFVTRDEPTTCGSEMLGGWAPPYEGTHAHRLSGAGGIILGKLAMDEFAMGSSNENTPPGWGPVRNPWSPAHVPGGSSGGSAAAVAAGLCDVALGSDTGGSIRQPASLCGVVGIKPTWGRVSRHGMIAFASSLDQAGVLARSVEDAALTLQVISGVDPRDATSAARPVPDWVAATRASIAGKTVGVFRRALALPGLHSEVASRFEEALAVLELAGARLIDIDLPHFDHAVATYYVLATAEAASNLARFDGLRYGRRVDGDDLVSTYERTRGDGFGAEVRRRILLGTFVLRADSYEQYYGRAMRVRRLIADDYAAAFTTCDVIATPVSPVPGFELGARVDDPLQMYLSDVFTIGANLAGLPAISIPAGFSSGSPRLPIGLQLLAPAFREDALFAFAGAHEQATMHHRARPPVWLGGPEAER